MALARQLLQGPSPRLPVSAPMLHLGCCGSLLTMLSTTDLLAGGLGHSHSLLVGLGRTTFCHLSCLLFVMPFLEVVLGHAMPLDQLLLQLLLMIALHLLKHQLLLSAPEAAMHRRGLKHPLLLFSRTPIPVVLL